MQGIKFRQPQRQIAVTFDALFKNLNMPWAIHGLYGKGFFVFAVLTNKHIVTEFIPVTRLFPQGFVHQNGGIHLLIPVLLHFFQNILHNPLINGPSGGVPENASGGLFLKMEQFHGTAQFSVVALLSFLQHG